MGTRDHEEQHPLRHDDDDLAGYPSWVDRGLIEATIRTWQPYYDSELTTDDALEMILGVGHLFDTVGPVTLAPSGGLAA